MNRYRILFIRPDAGVKFESIDVPLGILYLSAYLKEKMGNSVSTALVDLRLEKAPDKALLSTITQTAPDLIGISLLTFNSRFLDRYAGWLKQLAPDAKIVIGGPEATCNYARVLGQHRSINCAVMGEGEITFYHLVRAFMAGRDISDIEGIAYHNGETVICNEPREPIKDLDELPLPDYGLLRMKKYWSPLCEMNGILSEKRHIHIITSRACPYQCIYCHNIFGNKVRLRSPEHIVAQIQWLKDKYGIKEFHIVDDIFNLNKKRMRAIMNRIIASRINIKMAFPNGLRADILEKKDLVLLKQAGAYMVTFAIETASPRLQKKIRKNLNLEKALENIAFAHDIGLLVKGFFMLGFPDETPDEIRLTISVAAASKLDMASFFQVTPYPGTRLGEITKAMNPQWSAIDNYHFWSKNPFYQQATGFNITRAQKMAYIKFYTPARVIKTFLKSPRKIYTLKNWGVFILNMIRQK